jgi:hypothetical protein
MVKQHPLYVWRERHQLSRRLVAQALGIGHTYVWMIEKYERYPQIQVAARIVILTGGAVSYDQLLPPIGCRPLVSFTALEQRARTKELHRRTRVAKKARAARKRMEAANA